MAGNVVAGLISTALVLGINAVGASSQPVDPHSQAAIIWDTGIVQLEATDVRLSVDGVPAVNLSAGDARSYPGGPTYRTLEILWQDGDVARDLRFSFTSDGERWWISQVRHRSSRGAIDWVEFLGPTAVSAVGEPFIGSLSMVSSYGVGALEIEGIVLTAFEPGSVTPALAECALAIPPELSETVEPLAPGQPLANSGIEHMTPEVAHALLLEMGLCHTFRHIYNYPDGNGAGYSETWCVPPAGEISGIVYATDGGLTILVFDATESGPRDQPPSGWGCAP